VRTSVLEHIPDAGRTSREVRKVPILLQKSKIERHGKFRESCDTRLFEQTPPPPSSDRQICSGIIMPAKASNANDIAASAKTADLMRAPAAGWAGRRRRITFPLCNSVSAERT
jgi:hypothetical protein